MPVKAGRAATSGCAAGRLGEPALPRSGSPLAKSFAAVPEGTLHFLLPSFNEGTRKEFLAWAAERGRSKDTDWRPAWNRFVAVKTTPIVAAVAPIARHAWASRLRKAA
jgi:hypothetical protein